MIKLKDILAESITNKWAYHLTKIDNLKSIKEHGLDPDRFVRKHIFFCASARDWPAYDPSKQVHLRFPWPKNYYGPEYVKLGEKMIQEYMTRSKISPDNIQIGIRIRSKKIRWKNLTNFV